MRAWQLPLDEVSALCLSEDGANVVVPYGR